MPKQSLRLWGKETKEPTNISLSCRYVLPRLVEILLFRDLRSNAFQYKWTRSHVARAHVKWFRFSIFSGSLFFSTCILLLDLTRLVPVHDTTTLQIRYKINLRDELHTQLKLETEKKKETETKLLFDFIETQWRAKCLHGIWNSPYICHCVQVHHILT